jgi:PAS domain S-box-containing protein
LGLDYSELVQWDDEAKLFVITHSSAVHAGRPGLKFRRQDIPWVSAKVFRGEVIQFSRQLNLSEEAARDVETLFHAEIKSAAFFPIKTEEQTVGFISFGTSRAEGALSELQGDRLRFITEILTKTLTRKDFYSALRRSQERKTLKADELFQQVIEFFPTAVVLADNAGKIVLLNSRATEMFGYKRDDLVGRLIETLIPQCLRNAREAYHSELVEHSNAMPMGTARMLHGVRKGGSEFPVEVALAPFQIDGDVLSLSVITDITDRKFTEQALMDMNVQLLEANEQIREMKEHLERENLCLKQEIKPEANHFEIVGGSPAILRVLLNAEKVAATDSTVLLLGETGSGKELVARTIHRNSRRKTRTMVNVNCAALPATLVENELFGRERGAYTGALTREVGRFELADRSTIFLDEIGELPLELQSKLLRVLQEGEFERLGSSKTIHVDVRLIAATSRDLEAAVKEGKFREDLYYRLNVFPIRVPPLRERREDIPMLTWHFLRDLGGRMGRDIQSVRATTMKALQGYFWPGNVRELRNLIERNLIINSGPVFEAELPESCNAASSDGTSIEEVERNHVRRMLERSSWRVRGIGGAAEALGLKPTTLEARMKKLGIVRK